MSYSQALEEQVRMARGMLAAEEEEGILTDLVRAYDHENIRSRAAEEAMVEVILTPLLQGETFYWSPQMCELLERSAAVLPEWICDPSIAIVPCGFCHLAKPFRVGKQLLIAFGWGVLPGDAGLGVVCYSAQRAERAFVAVPSAFFVIPTRTEINARHESFDKIAVIGAALLLLQQRIISATSQRPQRAARKRLAAEGYQHEPLIRVVELRRKQAHSAPSGEHEAVEWSHQWIVSGHWRQQWYPSLNAHQPRWIMPYVKGPEDMPLKPPRAKVFAVVR